MKGLISFLKNKEKQEAKQKSAIENSKGDAKISKLLTLKQRYKRNKKPNLFLQWFWNQSIFKIGIIVSLIFFGLTIASTRISHIDLILNSLEPLGVLLAVVIFIRETPERKKQFHYQALSTIDRASGIRNSKARVIALQDLVDQGINLDELDLSNSNLEKIELNGVEIKGGNFMSANLQKSEMHLSNLQKSNFKNVSAAGFQIRFGNLSFSNFSESNFSNADFSNSNLMFSNFKNAKLSGTKFINSKLKGAKFEGAFLSGSNFTGADVDVNELKKAILTNAILPDGSTHK